MNVGVGRTELSYYGTMPVFSGSWWEVCSRMYGSDLHQMSWEHWSKSGRMHSYRTGLTQAQSSAFSVSGTESYKGIARFSLVESAVLWNKFPLFSHWPVCFFVYVLCVHAGTQGSADSLWELVLSTRFLGVELRSLCLMVNTFTHWTISLAQTHL